MVRVSGAIIFIFGFFLLFTIFFTILGIILMIVGLIMMIVGGGRRKVVINNVVSVNSPPAAVPRDMMPELQLQGVQQRREPLLQERPQYASLPSPNRDFRDPELRTINQEPYDRVKWKALVEYDPDISRVVSALSPYGQKYIDQLATGYLALNDKNYLPMIVQKILATAREDAAAQRG